MLYITSFEKRHGRSVTLHIKIPHIRNDVLFGKKLKIF